jgi:hypothetical protein
VNGYKQGFSLLIDICTDKSSKAGSNTDLKQNFVHLDYLTRQQNYLDTCIIFRLKKERTFPKLQKEKEENLEASEWPY